MNVVCICAVHTVRLFWSSLCHIRINQCYSNFDLVSVFEKCTSWSVAFLCQIGHGQPPVAFPSSQADRKTSSYASQSQQQPTASQSACELCAYLHHLLLCRSIAQHSELMLCKSTFLSVHHVGQNEWAIGRFLPLGSPIVSFPTCIDKKLSCHKRGCAMLCHLKFCA